MSKFRDANKKIEETVVGGYKKIEDAVVGGYKKVEDAVVGNYKKVEDKFVDAFLKDDGETTEEAKERVMNNQKEIEEKNQATIENAIKSTEEIQAEIHDKYGV